MGLAAVHHVRLAHRCARPAGRPPSWGSCRRRASGRRARRASTPILETNEERSGRALEAFSTSVSMISLVALSAVAIAAAAVSALTLRTVVASVVMGATEEMTGIRPAWSRSRTDGVDVDDVPDEADVHALAVHRGQALAGAQQAAVLTGDADGCRAVLVEQETASRWTLPVSTMRTTSMTSGVVMRRPPRNSLSMPIVFWLFPN